MRALALLAVLVVAAPSSQAAQGYALIVTNNRSLELSRPDLHYADDDGVKYADLFSELYGAANVTLLTELDRETRGLHPLWAERAVPPTRANLAVAMEELNGRLGDANREAVVHIVFAGHGDIDHGVGFIELADGRLTAGDLDEAVLSSLKHRTVHLVLDSCNSYFMLSPRGSRVERWAAPAPLRAGLLEKYPRLGAIISTSAEAVTYEWSELQSGIFSYEVRSGLRGAADVNNDGMVTYAELSAFVAVANRDVVNDLYRPKVFASGPLGDRGAPIVFLGGAARRLELAAGTQRRLTVRDENGVRVLDLHKESDTRGAVILPTDLTLNVFEARPSDEGGTETVVRTLPPGVSAPLSDLEESPPAIARRGEAPVFRSLFATPFGPSAFAEELGREAPETPYYGVSRRDVEALGLHLRSISGLYRDQRRQLAWTGLLGGAAVAAVGAGVLATNVQTDDSDSFVAVGGTYLGMGAVALAMGILYLAIQTDIEDLYDDYLEMDFSTEEARARNVTDIEARFLEAVDGARRRRITGGSVMIGFGAIGVAGAIMAASFTAKGPQEAQSLSYSFASAIGALGALSVGLGIYNIIEARDPMERTWEQWIDYRDSGGEGPDFSVAPLVDEEGRVGLSVGGSF